jgi:hypothetical protein
MDNQADSALIQQTQESLGKVITRVPLNDKLLGRPPFKFLHDIIKEVSHTFASNSQDEAIISKSLLFA